MTSSDKNTSGTNNTFIRESIAAFLIYLLLLLILLTDRGFSPTSQFIGFGIDDVDWAGHFWAMWHKMLFWAGQQQLNYTTMEFYPSGTNTLAIHGDLLITLLAGYIAFFISLDFAHLIISILAILTNAMGGFWLGRSVVGSRLAGGLMGLLFGFNGYTLQMVNTGNLDYAIWIWTCLYLLFFLRILRGGSFASSVLPAVLFGALAIYSNFAQVISLVLLSALLLLLHLRHLSKDSLIRFAFLAALIALALAPLVAAFRSQQAQMTFVDNFDAGKISGLGDREFPEPGSTWDVPSQSAAPINSFLPWNRGTAGISTTDTYFFAWAMLLVSLIVTWKKVWPWAVTGFIFFLLSLGPFIRIFDEKNLQSFYINLPLPYQFFHRFFPYFYRFQFPDRFFAISTIIFGICIGFGLAVLLKKRHGKVIASVFLALAALEISLAFPLVISPKPVVPEFYYGQPDDKQQALIEVPFDFNSIDTLYMFYQTRHQRPMINGMIGPFVSGDPTGGLIEGNTILNTLAKLQQPLVPMWHFSHLLAGVPPKESLEDAAMVLGKLGFSQVNLHKPNEMDPEQAEAFDKLHEFLIGALGEPTQADGPIEVYALPVIYSEDE